MAQQTIDDGELYLSVRTKINENFTDLYKTTGNSVYNAVGYSIPNSGTTDIYSTLNSLLTTISTTYSTIYFPTGTYKLSTNITIPVNVNLFMESGAVFSIDSGVTLTINGEITAGLWQIFSGSGDVGGKPKTSVFYPQWFGVVADGTDETTEIQKAIDTCSGMDNGLTLFFPRVTNNYRASKLELKEFVSIKSNKAKFEPVDSAETDFMYINSAPVTNVEYEGFDLVGNSNNAGQNGLVFKAVPQVIPAYTGGLWYTKIKNIRIDNFLGIGVYFDADDADSPGGDLATQFINIEKLLVFRNDSGARCLKLEGQSAQMLFTSCEFDATSTAIANENVNITSLVTSNDQVANIVFDNCTFQSAEKGIKTYFTFNLHIRDCWFESLKYGVDITSTSNVSVTNCHFANVGSDGSNTGYVLKCGVSCRLSHNDNYIGGTYDYYVEMDDNAYGVNGRDNIIATSPAQGLSTLDAPQVSLATNTLNVISHNSVFLSVASNSTLKTIQSNYSQNEFLTVYFWTGGSGYNLQVDITDNILLPAGITTVTLLQGDSIVFKRMMLPSPLLEKYIVVSHTGVEA